jgi:pSer/pThr/pTyr-binding forkhead associated (FHA) protein
MYVIESERGTTADVSNASLAAIAKLEAKPDLAQPHAYLMTVDNRVFSGIHALAEDELFIGRGGGCDIVVDDKSVSSKHAKLRLLEGGYHLQDLGSTNGTAVNGRPVRGHLALVGGDQLQVGEANFLYVVNTPELQLANGPEAQARAVVLAGDAPSPVVYRETARAFQPAASGGIEILDTALDVVAKGRSFLADFWKVIASATLVCALLGLAAGIMNPPRAEASIWIGLDPNEPTREETLGRRGHEFFGRVEPRFMRANLVAKTLTDVDGEAPTQREITDTTRALAIESEGSNVYRGSFLHPDATEAERFLGLHVDNYLKGEVDSALRVLEAETTRLRTDLESAATKLSTTEKALQELRAENLDGLPEDVGGAATSRLELRARKAALTAETQRLRAQATAARKEASRGDGLLNNKLARSQPYKEELSAVKRQLAEARGRSLGDQHPEVLSLKSRIRELEKLRDAALRKAPSDFERRADADQRMTVSRARELEIASRAAETELGLVSKQLKHLDTAAENLPEVEAAYSELMRDYTLTQQLHADLFKQLTTAELQLANERASEESRYEIFGPPEASPVSLRKIALIGTVGGGVFGFGIGLSLAAYLWIRQYARRRDEVATIVSSEFNHSPGRRA